MNFEEFLVDGNKTEANIPAQEESLTEPEELDVQKAVVEELAAEKVRMDVQLSETRQKVASLESEIESLKAQISELERKLAEEQERQFDEQARNPNSLALLDRDTELPDRFPGETRDHVIEVVREARDKAEAEGRIRRAQLLEGVLVANEPNGNLAQKRMAMEKFFSDNGNILSGPVIEELTRCGISYKNGEEYLLPSEILTRAY
jgi:hypothetical protein